MEAPEQRYAAPQPAGREHIPAYPRGFIGVRIAQLVVGVVVLGLCAYGLSALAFAGDELGIVTAIMTLIVCVYCLVGEFAAPALYNYWAVLSLDILLVILWLVSFAIMAAQIAPVMAYATGGGDVCYDGYCYGYSLSDAQMAYADCMAAVAGLGGLEFVLFLTTLIINGVFLHRHRAAGRHCTPITTTAAGGAMNPGAGAGPTAASTTTAVYVEKPIGGGLAGATPTTTVTAQTPPAQTGTGDSGEQAVPPPPHQQYQPTGSTLASGYHPQPHAGVPPNNTVPMQTQAQTQTQTQMQFPAAQYHEAAGSAPPQFYEAAGTPIAGAGVSAAMAGAYQYAT